FSPPPGGRGGARVAGDGGPGRRGTRGRGVARGLRAVIGSRHIGCGRRGHAASGGEGEHGHGYRRRRAPRRAVARLDAAAPGRRGAGSTLIARAEGAALLLGKLVTLPLPAARVAALRRAQPREEL